MLKVVLISCDKYTFFIDTANYLEERGYEVHAFCSKVPNNFNDGVIFHDDLVGRLDAEKGKLNIFILPLTAFKLRKLLQKISPDIVHALNVKWSGWVTSLSGWHPYILSGLGSDVLIEQKSESNWFLKLLKRHTISNADINTAMSGQMAKQMNLINPKPIEIFSTGADPRVFVLQEPEKAFIEKYGLWQKKVIFSPRGIRPIYRTKEIIKAFEILSKKNKDLMLVSGGSEKTDYARETKELVNELGLEKKVLFTGHSNINEWLEFYRCANIVVSFPYNDGMPATIFEAMAMHKPLVLSNIPSTNEICSDGFDAVICADEKVNTLASAMDQLLNNKELYQRIVNNAINTYMVKGNALLNFEYLEHIYKKALDIQT